MQVLCVVRDGVGLARALKRTITITSSASTNSVMARDEPEQEVVEPDDVVHHRRGGLLESQLPGRRLPEPGQGRAAAGKNGHAS